MKKTSNEKSATPQPQWTICFVLGMSWSSQRCRMISGSADQKERKSAQCSYLIYSEWHWCSSG